MATVRIIRPTTTVASITPTPTTPHTPMSGATSAPTITDAGALGDDNPATYVDLERHYTAPGEYTRLDAVDLIFPPQPDISGLMFANAYVTHTSEGVRRNNEFIYWFDFGPTITEPGGGISGYDGLADSVTGSFTTTPVTTWGSISVHHEVYPARTAQFEALFKAGATMTLHVWHQTPTDYGVEQSSRVFEAGIELIFERAPILRVYPRSDGRGLSSARRVWPPSKTVQDRRWQPYGGGYR